jgi:hypothetical protein
MWQKNAHHHNLIQVPSVDVTPDLSTSLLDTTFKCLNSKFYFKTIQQSPSCDYMTVICYHLICVRWKGVPAQSSVLLPFQWECMTFDWGSWGLQEVWGKTFQFWLMTEQVEDRRQRSWYLRWYKLLPPLTPPPPQITKIEYLSLTPLCVASWR